MKSKVIIMATKWFIGCFILTLICAGICEEFPNIKREVFYFIATPSIIMMGVSTFAIVVNAIHTNHEKRYRN
jgi:hypothetical protein